MSRLAILAVLLAGTALAMPGCRKADGAKPAAPPAPDPVRGVRLATPEKMRFAPEVLATGNLEAQSAAPLAFAVPGTLQQVLVRRGQQVAEGAPLGRLDADLARAAMAQAEASRRAAEAQARLAQDAFERASLIHRQEGVSEAQLVQAEAQRDLARAQALAAAAQQEQARVGLARHTLRAPFAGVVTRVPDGPGITVGAGVPLFALESTRRLTLRTSLTQEEAAGVRPGTRVAVAVPATGAHTAEAVVQAVVPSIEAATGRVPVEVAVPNADGRFLAHASARATFPAGAPREAWRVPSASLVQREGAFAVWTAGRDGKARAVPVRLVQQQAEAALVDPGPGGWPAGLRVVEAPPIGVAEGMALAEAAP